MKKSNKAKRVKHSHMYPPDLYKMVRLIYKSHGRYCVSSAIRFLQDHRIDTVDVLHNGYSKLNYVRWTEFFFSSMYPLSLTESCWKEHEKDLFDILTHAEELLEDISKTPNTYSRDRRGSRGNRTIAGYDHRRSDCVVIRQHFSLHFAVIYWARGDEFHMLKEFRTILEDTKANVTYLLKQEFADMLLVCDRRYPSSFYVHEMSYWRPIEWLYREAQGSMIEPTLAIFEDYVEFLRNFQPAGNKKVHEMLLCDAERQLLCLYKKLEVQLEKDLEKQSDSRSEILQSRDHYREKRNQLINTMLEGDETDEP